MDWISVVIEEYKTVREESLTSMQTQQSVLHYGTTTLGIMVVAGFNVWDKAWLPELIFLVFVPLVSYLVLITWTGEVARMMRAGRFLAKLEGKVNHFFKEKSNALMWESWLRENQPDGKTPQLIWNYKAIISLFLLIAFLAIGVGHFKIHKVTFIYYSFRWIIDGIEAFVFFGAIFFVGEQVKRFR
ncbi:MAG: hypothetical protein WC614_05505 [bacterium]